MNRAQRRRHARRRRIAISARDMFRPGRGAVEQQVSPGPGYAHVVVSMLQSASKEEAFYSLYFR